MCSSDLLLDGCIQIDDVTPSAQVTTILRVDDGAAACRQYDAVHPAQVVNDGCFALAETLLTFLLKDKCYIDACSRLDFVVTINKRQMKCARQETSDSRLACAHRSNEKDVLGMFHKNRWLMCESESL